MSDIKEDIEKSLAVLNAGGLILYPTDTVWGIGCDATNPEAVAKIYALKQRNPNKSMLILLDNINKIYNYVDDVPEIALDIIELADKPTTVIFSNAKNLADNLIAEDGSIGIRIVDADFCNRLLARFKKPIVSTSANISAEPSPQNFSEISDEIKEKIDYIVQWQQTNSVSIKPSSVIKIDAGGLIKIIRK